MNTRSPILKKSKDKVFTQFTSSLKKKLENIKNSESKNYNYKNIELNRLALNLFQQKQALQRINSKNKPYRAITEPSSDNFLLLFDKTPKKDNTTHSKFNSKSVLKQRPNKVTSNSNVTFNYSSKNINRFNSANVKKNDSLNLNMIEPKNPSQLFENQFTSEKNSTKPSKSKSSTKQNTTSTKILNSNSPYQKKINLTDKQKKNLKGSNQKNMFNDIYTKTECNEDLSFLDNYLTNLNPNSIKVNNENFNEKQKKKDLNNYYSSDIISEKDLFEIEKKFDLFLIENNQINNDLEDNFYTEYLEKLFDFFDEIAKDKRFSNLFNKLSVTIGFLVNLFVEQIVSYKHLLSSKINENRKIENEKTQMHKEFLKLSKENEYLINCKNLLQGSMTKTKKVNFEEILLENKKSNDLILKQKNFIQEKMMKEEKMMKLLYAIGKSGIDIEKIFIEQVLTPSKTTNVDSNRSNDLNSPYTFKDQFENNLKTKENYEKDYKKSEISFENSFNINENNKNITKINENGKGKLDGNKLNFIKKDNNGDPENNKIDNEFYKKSIDEPDYSEFSENSDLIIDEEREIQKLREQGLLDDKTMAKIQESKKNEKSEKSGGLGLKLALGNINFNEITNHHDEVWNNFDKFSKTWRELMMKEKTLQERT